ncbi:hypothetical protein CS022_18120 [Veronia nyctiphanis]|uniref:Uncharacterized protein n=1 Tax=Veronia nyctiphanis TaxID=1278244 RepID=A0A4Q0YMQ5_9GAMM|nr:hypothetical protein [Veronia nyctiphanis]RXJ72046.1 hypothetical protein CS022_18120 [Veronia nyctiphanis]
MTATQSRLSYVPIVPVSLKIKHCGKTYKRQTDIYNHLCAKKLVKVTNHSVYGLDAGHVNAARWYSENGLPYSLIHWEKGQKDRSRPVQSIEHIDTGSWNFLQEETLKFNLPYTLRFVGINFTFGKNSGMNGSVRIQKMIDGASFKKRKGVSPFRAVFSDLEKSLISTADNVSISVPQELTA